jgi:hypothetical protein
MARINCSGSATWSQPIAATTFVAVATTARRRVVDVAGRTEGSAASGTVTEARYGGARRSTTASRAH